MENIEKILLELYKETYYKEFERKDNLNSYINIPLTIITLLFGVFAILINNLPKFTLSLFVIIFYFFFICFFFCLIRSVYFFIRSIFNYEYGFIANSEEIERYFNKLKNYNSIVKESKTIEINKEINDMLKEQYCKYSEINYKNNNKKSKFIHKTTSAMVFCVAFTFVCGAFYFINKYNQPVETLKVEIVNKKEVFMLDDDKKENLDSTRTTNNSNTQSDEPEIPQRPEGKLIKEGNESATKKKTK